MVVGCAGAQPTTDPHGFPVLPEYSEVTAGEFLRTAPSFNGLAFQTPDGLACSHNGFNSVSTASS